LYLFSIFEGYGLQPYISLLVVDGLQPLRLALLPVFIVEVLFTAAKPTNELRSALIISLRLERAL
jgi:hypothetical protein